MNFSFTPFILFLMVFFLWCISPLLGTTPIFFLFGLIEERRLITDFISSLGSSSPVVHATPDKYKTQQSSVGLCFCLRKSCPGKSRGSPSVCSLGIKIHTPGPMDAN